MGYDIDRFVGRVDEELICPICTDVLKNPVQVLPCEHTFCELCILTWLEAKVLPTCPVDRLRLKRKRSMKPVPRIFRTLLSRLDISCKYSNVGCQSVVKLDALVSHESKCEYIPKEKVEVDPSPQEQVVSTELEYDESFDEENDNRGIGRRLLYNVMDEVGDVIKFICDGVYETMSEPTKQELRDSVRNLLENVQQLAVQYLNIYL